MIPRSTTGAPDAALDLIEAQQGVVSIGQFAARLQKAGVMGSTPPSPCIHSTQMPGGTFGDRGFESAMCSGGQDLTPDKSDGSKSFAILRLAGDRERSSVLRERVFGAKQSRTYRGGCRGMRLDQHAALEAAVTETYRRSASNGYGRGGVLPSLRLLWQARANWPIDTTPCCASMRSSAASGAPVSTRYQLIDRRDARHHDAANRLAAACRWHYHHQ